MVIRFWPLAFLWFVAACATAPRPTPAPRLQEQASESTPDARIQFVSASTGAPLEPSRIGKADLDKARALLTQARNELEPGQWEILDGKLAQAERAWERFNSLAKASGRAAEVARGAEGVAEAGRASEAGRGLEALHRAGPLLALLILLWPASTAGPEYDELPAALRAQEEFEAKLREVSKASQQVQAELMEAARRNALRKPKPPEVREFPIPSDWKPGPGKYPYGPCFHKGTSGRGAFVPEGAPPDWISCTYQCGKYQVILHDIRGTSDKDCEQEVHLKRAEKEAENFDRRKQKGR